MSNMTSTCIEMIHSLYESGGEGSPSNPVKFKGQDYKKLKETLLREGRKFVDETFPANLSSIGKLEEMKPEQIREIKWQRACEFEPEAVFIKDGASRLDFKQGNVGNCWFLSAIGSLTLLKTLMAQVVPLDQNFKEQYAGIFHFRFWRFGKWVDVVIDDLLPIQDGAPLSVSSRSGKEFWAPLLEKAYAKVCGSYGDMIAGNPREGFKDFSGGVYMNYKLSNSHSDLWDVMNRALQCKTMMGCGTFTKEKGTEYFKKFGLVDGHAFSVTGVKQVESQGQRVNLVRIWNPWGEKEWNGDWSDKSALWNTVSDAVRHECLKVSNDGEFWMKMEDFCVYFQDMDICCDTPNFVDKDPTCKWHCSLKEGRWQAGKSAGGCNSEIEEFWTNPQYRLTVKGGNGHNNVLLSLLQKPDEKYRSKVKYHDIGFILYKAPKGRLTSSHLQSVSALKVSEFTPFRELIEVYSLQPAEYLVIPCTYDPNKTSSFIITIYSKAEAQAEMNEEP